MSPATPLSAGNPALKHLRRLSGRRRSRRDHAQYLVEGPKLVAEALGDGIDLAAVYAEAGPARDLAPAADGAGVAVVEVAPGALDRVLGTVSPQPVVAVANGAPLPVAELGRRGGGLVLVLVGVADPGNAGTLVRTAEACGAVGVAFVAGSVDPLAPKVVRAAAGSAWRVPLHEGPDLAGAVAALRAAGWRAVGTAARGGTSYDRADLAGDVALVLGSEARGLGPGDLALLDEVVSIPLQGRVESLNVAVAGSLLCFERARRAGP